MKNIVVAIDGPAGSGKGTITKIIASDLNLVYIDTGAMYRSVALLVFENSINLDDKESIINIAKNANIIFDEKGNTFINGRDVSKLIRGAEVSKIVSPVSAIVEVRKILVDLQRKMANDKSVIMEGRDITTVVFPNADYKFYLDADLECRAKRRFEQNKENNINTSYDEILENIRKRDYNDMHKEVGALIKSPDAIYIDSTNISICEVVEKIENVIKGGNDEFKR